MIRPLALCAAVLAAACSGNGGQDAGPTDARAGDTGVHADASGDDTETPADDTGSTDLARDFTLLVHGASAQQGHAVQAWVVDDTALNVIGFVQLTSIANDEEELRLPSLVPPGSYHADVFIDANGNGQYDGPSTDPSWRVAMNDQSSATARVALTDATTDIATPARMARRDVTVHLAGLTSADYGHRLELRVIDPGSRATVGGYANPRLGSSPTLDVTLPGVVDANSTYTVDLWIDADDSGTYSPGSDPSWEASVTADDNAATLSWTRSTDYTQLDWR